MKIETSALGCCSVVEGGERISLGLVDDGGRAIEIKISTSDACAIAMTLPRLLKNSLTEKYHDDSLRYVFPLEGWQVEAASNGAQVILTLSTGGGFEVSFTTNPDMCRSLGSALDESTRQAVSTPAMVPN